jgi:hypothetical protein
MPSETVEMEKLDSEGLKAYADAVVEEVAAERRGEEKPDVDVASNTETTKELNAEKKSGEKAAEVESDSDDTGETVSLPRWVDDKVKAEMTAYGIDDSELSEFASRDELEKVLRFLDKKALEAGRKVMAESEKEPARNEKGQFSKKQDTKEEDDQDSAVSKSSDRYEVSLSKDLYDDEIVDEFSRLRDHYESRLERLESQFAYVNAKSEEERFDSYVDSLGYAESERELERRKDLHVAVKAQMIGLERLGRSTELTDQLVSRVANMVFADEIGKKRLKQQTQRISRQSQMRLGGSPTKPQPPRDDPREEADRLYKELERS